MQITMAVSSIQGRDKPNRSLAGTGFKRILVFCAALSIAILRWLT